MDRLLEKTWSNGSKEFRRRPSSARSNVKSQNASFRVYLDDSFRLSKFLDFSLRFSDGAQNMSGKVAVKVDSFAMSKLRRKIIFQSNYNIIKLFKVNNYLIKYYKLEQPDQEASCNVFSFAHILDFIHLFNNKYISFLLVNF